MSEVHLFIKNGNVEHFLVHWREAIKILEGKNFSKGVVENFIFLDEDKKRIISSQDCFKLIDLQPKTIQKFLTEYDCEEY